MSVLQDLNGDNGQCFRAFYFSFGLSFLWYYHWTTFWQNPSFAFFLAQFSTILPLECLELFPKHLIHRLIILLHRNLWVGYCANIEQVLGPPFDKMSRPVTARQACQIQSPMTHLWGPCTKDCTKHIWSFRCDYKWNIDTVIGVNF